MAGFDPARAGWFYPAGDNLGHSRPITTHAYVEADLKMKADCLRRLTAPKMPKDRSRDEQSRLLAFLEAVR